MVVADRRKVPVEEIGTWKILKLDGMLINIPNTRYVRGLSRQLLSPNRLCESGRYYTIQDDKEWCMYEKGKNDVLL